MPIGDAADRAPPNRGIDGGALGVRRDGPGNEMEIHSGERPCGRGQVHARFVFLISGHELLDAHGRRLGTRKTAPASTAATAAS